MARRRLVLMAAVSFALIILVVVIARQAPTTIPLKGISSKQLAEGDIGLYRPGFWETAATSKEAAASVALAEFPIRKDVKQEVLARVHYRMGPGSGDQLCWVVDVTPDGGFPLSAGPQGSGETSKARWFLVFVDAQTGQFQFAHAGG